MKKNGIRYLAFLILLWITIGCSAQGENDAHHLAFRMIGTPARSAKQVLLMKKPGSKAGAQVIKKGDTCQVIGHQGRYYMVSFGQQTGYVLQEELTLNGELEKSPLKEESLSTLKLENYTPKRHIAKNLQLSGTIRSSKEIDTLYFYIWDLRRLRPEKALLVPLNQSSRAIPVSSIKKS